MRLTLRTKLMAIVGVASFACLLLTSASALIASRVEGRLRMIQQTYVPKVELEPLLESQFERMQRAFQDGVSSRDLDAIAATARHKQAFLAELAAAESAVNSAEATSLRAALEDYYAAATDVARRMIHDETGEDLTEAIAAMQAKQAQFTEALRRTTAFDRRELSDAFSGVVRAEAAAKMYRLWISVACVVAVLVLSTAISRGVLRSLASVTDGFHRLGKGDFAETIEVTSRDELADLAEQANQMAANLERLVAELKAAEGALKVVNRELEAFSYSVAHDLRSPLRGMSGFAQILLDSYRDKLDADAQDCLQEILLNAQKMGALIDALLSLSRTTRVEVNREWTDLSTMARSCASQLAIANSGRSVQVEIADDLWADVDAALARALLDNLVGNAWKFSSKVDSPRIEVGLTEREGERAFFVRDNGAGFDMAFATKLFGPFQRLHTTAEFPGTGVGLATVWRIVQRHGGRVWAEGSVGHGATFYFTLPSRVISASGGPPS